MFGSWCGEINISSNFPQSSTTFDVVKLDFGVMTVCLGGDDMPVLKDPERTNFATEKSISIIFYVKKCAHRTEKLISF